MFSIAAPCAGRRASRRAENTAVRRRRRRPTWRSNAEAPRARCTYIMRDLHVAGYNQVLLVVQVKLSKGALGVVVQVVLT